MLCPICDRDNAVDARRCKACGADFEDPEIASQLVRPAGFTDDDEPNLIGDRYLGVRWIGLEAGGDIRRWALLGALALAAGAILPLSVDGQKLRAAWTLFGDGPTLALVVPLVLAAIGIALATPLGRMLPPVAVAAVLAVGGAVTLGVVAPRLGGTGMVSTRAWWGVWFGLAIAGAGVMLRVLRRRDPNVRWIIAGGAALVAIGFLFPYTDARAVLPIEYDFAVGAEDLSDQSIIGASLAGFDAGGLLRFLSLWHLAALALVGVATGFAMQTSAGPWDKAALVLRPVGWVIAFWLPATLVLYAVNILGWHDFAYAHIDGRYFNWDKLTTALFFGRARLALLMVGATAWTVVGLAGIYATAIGPRLAATAGPDRTASAR